MSDKGDPAGPVAHRVDLEWLRDGLDRYLADPARHAFLTITLDKARSYWLQVATGGSAGPKTLVGNAVGNDHLKPGNRLEAADVVALQSLGWVEDTGLGTFQRKWPAPVDPGVVAEDLLATARVFLGDASIEDVQLEDERPWDSARRDRALIESGWTAALAYLGSGLLSAIFGVVSALVLGHGLWPVGIAIVVTVSALFLGPTDKLAAQAVEIRARTNDRPTGEDLRQISRLERDVPIGIPVGIMALALLVALLTGW